MSVLFVTGSAYLNQLRLSMQTTCNSTHTVLHTSDLIPFSRFEVSLFCFTWDELYCFKCAACAQKVWFLLTLATGIFWSSAMLCYEDNKHVTIHISLFFNMTSVSYFLVSRVKRNLSSVHHNKDSCTEKKAETIQFFDLSHTSEWVSELYK